MKKGSFFMGFLIQILCRLPGLPASLKLACRVADSRSGNTRLERYRVVGHGDRSAKLALDEGNEAILKRSKSGYAAALIKDHKQIPTISRIDLA